MSCLIAQNRWEMEPPTFQPLILRHVYQFEILIRAVLVENERLDLRVQLSLFCWFSVFSLLVRKTMENIKS